MKQASSEPVTKTVIMGKPSVEYIPLSRPAINYNRSENTIKQKLSNVFSNTVYI